MLDFGLAKVFEGEAADVNLSNSPTKMTASMPGTILGTAAYMPPEQAQGKPADKRADIWAFGVVLYEMLTGRRLFEGDTVAGTLAALLTKEPEWDRVPARARPLLRRCLVKDPQRRLRDIGDAMALADSMGSLDNVNIGDVPAWLEGGAATTLAPRATKWSRLLWRFGRIGETLCVQPGQLEPFTCVAIDLGTMTLDRRIEPRQSCESDLAAGAKS